MKNQIKVTYDDGIVETITIDEAINKLNGYWKINTIEQMLIDGNVLFTPYATFELINKK